MNIDKYKSDMVIKNILNDTKELEPTEQLKLLEIAIPKLVIPPAPPIKKSRYLKKRIAKKRGLAMAVQNQQRFFPPYKKNESTGSENLTKPDILTKIILYYFIN